MHYNSNLPSKYEKFLLLHGLVVLLLTICHWQHCRRYVTGNIPGPAEDTAENEALQGNYNSMLLESCKCNKLCVKMLCNCLKISHGDNYNRYICDETGELSYTFHHKTDIFKDYPIIECNSNCTCPRTCGNRVVQNGPIEGLIVKDCEDGRKGVGLFTSRYISKGTFVCEYAGELLTRAQAKKRTEENEAQGKMNYIFCLNEYCGNSIIQTFVDPSMFGNIGRYINHSCEPNCRVVPVRSEMVIPHLAIFACTDIWPEQEITFNYGAQRLSGPELFPSTKKKECYCNTLSCKRFLPDENF